MKKTLILLLLVGFISVSIYGMWWFIRIIDLEYNQEGRDFSFKSEYKVIVNQTTKKQVIDIYGSPYSSTTKGKYQIVQYYIRKDFDDGSSEWKSMVLYTDISTGVVKDYFYHDSKLTGQDAAESLYLQSIALVEKGKNQDAIKALEKAALVNPNNHRALNALALQYIDLGIDIDQGIQYAQKAVEIFPDSPDNNCTLGTGYFKKGNLKMSEKYLDNASQLFPNYFPVDEEIQNNCLTLLNSIKKGKTIK